MIYFVGNIDHNVCKIGFSNRPYRRITTIRQGVPFDLHVFNIMDGDTKTEKLLHNLYSDYHIKGEWYELDKVKELDINQDCKFEMINEILFIVNSDKYFHLTTLLCYVNDARVRAGQAKIEQESWMKNNDNFIKRLKREKITPFTGVNNQWCHLYVALDIMRFCNIAKITSYTHINEILQLMKSFPTKNLE